MAELSKQQSTPLISPFPFNFEPLNVMAEAPNAERMACLNVQR